MQQISKTAEAVHSELVTRSEKSEKETSKKTGLPRHWISALFDRFDVRYPHKWSSGIEGREELAIEEWSQVLDKLTGNDIKRGLGNWKGEWPPSAPEFLKACQGSSANEFGLDYTPQCYHTSNNAIRDKARLLSNDERNKNRKSFRDNLHALANSLNQNEKTQE